MIVLDNTKTAGALCSQWLGEARKEVLIASESLATPCLSEAEVYDNLSGFVRYNQRTQLKILVSEPTKVNLSLGVIRLCQRLTSHCQIRVIKDTRNTPENTWVIDQERYIHWQQESACIGRANTNRPHSQKLHQLFFEHWHYNSEASPEFSLLHI